MSSNPLATTLARVSKPRTLAGLIALTALLSLLAAHLRRKTHPLPRLASHHLPLVGHFLLLRKGIYHFATALFDATDATAVAVRAFGRPVFFAVRGPANARAVLANSGVQGRPSEEEAAKELRVFESGIAFNNNLPVWKHNRKLVAEGLNRPRFLRSLAPKISAHVDHIFPLLDSLAETGTRLPAPRFFAFWTMDVTYDITFSLQNHECAQYLRSLVDGTGKEDAVEGAETLTIMTDMAKAFAFFMRTPAWMRRWVPSVRRERDWFRERIERFYGMIQELIDAKRATLAADPDPPTSIDFCTSLLLDPQTALPENVSELHANLRAALLGGTETSANTLAFCLWEVAKREEVGEKVAREVEEVCGMGEVEVEDVGKMKYLEAVLNETHRLHAVAPASNRIVPPTGLTLEDGTHLPPNSTVVVLSATNHVDPHLWPRPLEFDPDRFFGEIEGGGKGANGYGFKLLPFGYGVRKCPGEALATTVMKLTLANLLRRYRVRLADPTLPLQKVTGSLAVQCGSYDVILERRGG